MEFIFLSPFLTKAIIFLRLFTIIEEKNMLYYNLTLKCVVFGSEDKGSKK